MRAFVLLVAVLALAGCASPGAVVTGGIRVLVTDEPGGPPVEGVRLFATDGGWWYATTDEATTDAEGRATLRVPVGSTVELNAPGFVWERRALDDDAVALPLFKERITIDVAGTLEGGDVQRPIGEPAWSPQEVLVAGTAEGRAGYALRLVTLNATLAWTNGLAGGGDLALGIAGAPGEPDFYQDSDEMQATPGAHEESLRLSHGEFQRENWGEDARIFVGPAPGKAYAAPSGIDYVIHLEAVFGAPRELPGAPVGAIVALAVAALVGRSFTSSRR